MAALQRLQTQLNKEGLATLAGRVTAAQSLLLGPAVARALDIRAAVLQRRRPRIHNPLCSNVQMLAKDVSSPTRDDTGRSLNSTSNIFLAVRGFVGSIEFAVGHRIGQFIVDLPNGGSAARS